MLRRVRLQRGLSIPEAVARIGAAGVSQVSQVTLRSYEAGRRVPSPGKMIRIINAYGYEVLIKERASDE